MCFHLNQTEAGFDISGITHKKMWTSVIFSFPQKWRLQGILSRYILDLAMT